MDKCKPGDRVSVVGVYRAVPPRAQGPVSGILKAQVVALGLTHLARDAGTICRALPAHVCMRGGGLLARSACRWTELVFSRVSAEEQHRAICHAHSLAGAPASCST